MTHMDDLRGCIRGPDIVGYVPNGTTATEFHRDLRDALLRDPASADAIGARMIGVLAIARPRDGRTGRPLLVPRDAAGLLPLAARHPSGRPASPHPARRMLIDQINQLLERGLTPDQIMRTLADAGAAPAAVGLAMIAVGIDRVARVNRAAALELLEEIRGHAQTELTRLRSLH